MAYQESVQVRYQTGIAPHVYLPGIITESGILISHLRYLYEYSHKSNSWKKASTYALKLLMKYAVKFEDLFDSPLYLLKSFADTLCAGTIDLETLQDESGLFWRPKKSSYVAKIIFHITSYAEFIARQNGFEENMTNPVRKASTYEERMNLYAFYHKNKNVFLSHLNSTEKAKINAEKIRHINIKRESSVYSIGGDIKRFPSDSIDSFIYEGLRLDNGQHDYKSMAMVMLMHYGGLRVSELFHLFINDIVVAPELDDGILVRVYDPVYGEPPDNFFSTRLEYLNINFGLMPRNKMYGKLEAGWKNPLLTDKRRFFEVYFSSSERAREFKSIWINYLKLQYINPSIGKAHPYLFVNSYGNPETIANFRKLYVNGLEKIGLQSKKNLGTTFHGHRHSYGYRLAEMGLSQVEIQKCLHHRHPESCLVYLSPNDDDIRIKMKKTSLVNNGGYE